MMRKIFQFDHFLAFIISLIVVHVQLATGKLLCPTKCSCLYVEGRLTTDCSNAGFVQVPTNVPASSMILLLDGNDFSRLKRLNFFVNGQNTSNLRELVVRNCRVTEFMAEDLWPFASLHRLSLANNIIKRLPFALCNHARCGAFHTMADLKECKFHQQTMFQCKIVTSLPQANNTLDLSGNELDKLEANQFEGAVRMTELILSKNKIAHIDKDAFHGLPALRRIMLDRNALSTIYEESFRRLLNLHVLNLMQNPWHCNCMLRLFIAWQRNKYLTEPPVCYTPSAVQGKRWDQLTLNEFACAPRAVTWSSRRQTVKVGKVIHLECLVSGDPEPTVEWRFYNYDNETTVVGGASGAETNYHEHADPNSDQLAWIHHLSVVATSSDVMGLYHCVASNPGGSSYAVFQVNEHDNILLITIVVVIAIVLVMVISAVVIFFRRPSAKQNINSVVSYPVKQSNGYGYVSVTDYGDEATYAQHTNAATVECQREERPTPRMPDLNVEKWHLVDEDGFYSTKAPFAILNASATRYSRSSATGPAASDRLSDVAPLAADEWEEPRMPLRETAL
ncbi:Leucine-rich repeat-containing protein 24 [Trichinella pseudospiralis]|uniref:Leucine-rich repeat-containing protein 24 n=1 Tax=Trichinella pseudospiralis TaxID=6337 RepID=A0A0V1G161_TRIPS|nr:Leucine-rich repeat-containing protein 24 [Trichinella pseudospiralis]